MNRFTPALCVLFVASVAWADDPLRLPAAEEYSESMAYSADGNHLVHVNGSGVVTTHDLRSGKVLHRFSLGKERCDFIAPTFVADGGTLAVVARPAGQRDGELLLYDVVRGKPTKRWPMKEAAGSLAESPDGKILAAAVQSGIRVYDPATGDERQVMTVESGESVFGGVRWTPDGKRLLVSIHGKMSQSELLVCDATTGTVDHRLPIASIWYAQCAFAVRPGGTEVVMYNRPDPATGKAEVAVWDLSTGKQLRKLGECGFGSELALTPDGKRFVTCDQPGRKVVMGDVATGKVVAVWAGWRGTGITVSPDGNSFVTEGKDVAADKPFSGFMRVRIDHLK